MKVKKETHYNHLVSVNLEMDKLRKTECLCFNCGNQPACLKSETLYKLCVEENIAMMITRCEDFIESDLQINDNDIWKVKVSLRKSNSIHNTLIVISHIEKGEFYFKGLLYESSKEYNSKDVEFIQLIEKVNIDY